MDKMNTIDKTKKVWLDPKLKKYIVPSEMRNNSKSDGKVFTPGTRLSLKKAEFIRLFTAWSTKDGTAGSIDIDLGAAFIKEDSEGNLEMTPISYYNQSEAMAVHSGDFTSCRNFDKDEGLITAEYIDIDIQKTKDSGYKYIISSEFIYSGAESYDELYAVSGVQLLSGLRTEKKGFININDYLFRVELSGKFQSHCALAIDLETLEIVIIEQYSEEQQGMNVDSMANKMNEFKKLYFNASGFKENMYDFLTIYCEANEIEIVKKIDECDIICSYDDRNLEDTVMFNVSDNLEKIINLLN